MNHRPQADLLGPLLTITEEELSRPARRREDRDILILRIEIEAQRREVARLTQLAGERLRGPDLRKRESLILDQWRTIRACMTP